MAESSVLRSIQDSQPEVDAFMRRYADLRSIDKLEEREALAQALREALTLCKNNSYRRGMIDQCYQPLPSSSIARIRIAMQKEGLGDPSWPSFDLQE